MNILLLVLTDADKKVNVSGKRLISKTEITIASSDVRLGTVPYSHPVAVFQNQKLASEICKLKIESP